MHLNNFKYIIVKHVNKVLLSDFCPYLGCLVDNFAFKFMKQNTIMKITQNNTILYQKSLQILIWNK